MKSFKPSSNSLRNKLVVREKFLNKISLPRVVISIKPRAFSMFNKYIVLLSVPGLVSGTIKIFSKLKTNFISNFIYLCGTPNFFFYKPATHSIIVGNVIQIHGKHVGSFLKFKYFNKKMIISQIFSQYVRAAGSFATFFRFRFNRALVQLPSKRFKLFDTQAFSVIGRNGNLLNKFERLGNAGYKKYFFKKSVVRGEAKNAVDHPHGGRTRGGKPKKSPWGWTIH